MTTVLWCLVAALVVTLFTLLVMWRQLLIYKEKLADAQGRAEYYHAMWVGEVESKTSYAAKIQETFHRVAEEISYSNLTKAEMARILAQIPLSRS